MLNVRPHTSNQTGVSTCWRPFCFPGMTCPPHEDTGQDVFSPHRQTVCVTLKLRLNYGKFTEKHSFKLYSIPGFHLKQPKTAPQMPPRQICRNPAPGTPAKKHVRPCFFQARFLFKHSFRNFSVNPAADMEKTQHNTRRHNKHFPSLKPPIFQKSNGMFTELCSA